ncbi:restriction endonuclease subunit S [Vibrio alginolyticus]|uniref:restriction endonuclease subunit S n=1 Tax=Vibrio alginolyticus TaxID=663 RepID=UPI001F2E6DF3|nr:restriction endonuclease subunit S [Vibrio alginolyticus]MCE9823536.1 restriction endonuclease subunit S [Vibrio alginolyticus]
MVPSVSLEDLLDLSQYGLSVSSVDNGQYPMFKMNNFRDGFMSEKGVDTVNLDETEFDKYRLEYGDILFNRTNSIDLVGKTGVFTLEGDYVFASYLVRLKVNRDIADPFYLNYFMNFDATKLRLRSLATKAVSQANINPTQLKKLLKVPLLPLPEQRKIAKILSTWDKAINITEKLIETSKQQKKALMQQLLTGKKRLVNPETGKVFEGDWEEVKLKDITQFIKDGTHGTHERYDKGIPMLSAANITKNHKVNFEGAPNISEEDYNKIHSKYEIVKGDILLTVVGTLGRVAIVPKTEKFTLQRSVAIIRTSSKSHNQYLMQLFSSIEFTHLLVSKSNSTAQAGVYLGELAKIKLLLPPIEEQQKIASVLAAADKEIEILTAKLAHFKQEKKALMQQLLTGKRRVKIEEMEFA